ncbi:hypothetical protein J5U22_01418 [Saccharolobus shibatae]|uniref:Uncharacterized protein n=1 Tax=Saccharolobus shibatae TaxID=2286 RepID=A0A8F5C0P9_9CREN|nr:hypothetical protein J5U22_01418 [Saccharolobus shibatae]
MLIFFMFEFMKVISEEDVRVVDGFLPRGLKFVSKVLRLLT